MLLLPTNIFTIDNLLFSFKHGLHNCETCVDQLPLLRLSHLIIKLFVSHLALSLGILLFQQKNKRKKPNWINVSYFAPTLGFDQDMIYAENLDNLVCIVDWSFMAMQCSS